MSAISSSVKNPHNKTSLIRQKSFPLGGGWVLMQDAGTSIEGSELSPQISTSHSLMKPATLEELSIHFVTTKAKEELNKPIAHEIDKFMPQVRQILEPPIETICQIIKIPQNHREFFVSQIVNLVISLAKQVSSSVLNQMIPDDKIHKLMKEGIKRHRNLKRKNYKEVGTQTDAHSTDVTNTPFIQKLVTDIIKGAIRNNINSLAHSFFEKLMNHPIEVALTLALKPLPIADDVKLLIIDGGKYIAVNYAKNFISYQLKRTLSGDEWKDIIKKLDRFEVLTTNN